VPAGGPGCACTTQRTLRPHRQSVTAPYCTRPRRLWRLLQRQDEADDATSYLLKGLPAAQREQLAQLFLAHEATSAALAAELEACLKGRAWAEAGMKEVAARSPAGLAPSQALLQGWAPHRRDDEPEALPVVPIPQDLALQLVSFHLGSREQRGDMAEWLVNNATKLLHAGTLSAQGWSSLLQQHPELLLAHPRQPAAEPGTTVKWQAPLVGTSQLPLAVASLPEAEQLAVVQAALQWWRQQVGLPSGVSGLTFQLAQAMYVAMQPAAAASILRRSGQALHMSAACMCTAATPFTAPPCPHAGDHPSCPGRGCSCGSPGSGAA
jgi:hypothetical protein